MRAGKSKDDLVRAAPSQSRQRIAARMSALSASQIFSHCRTLSLARRRTPGDTAAASLMAPESLRSSR
eukprot:1904642-Rhodomonas_salina.3